MISIRILLDGDRSMPDLAPGDERIIHLGNDAPPMWLTALAGGMTSGKPSVMIRLDLPDGRIVMAETSLSLLLAAADAFRGRYGDPREPPVVW